MEQLYLNDFHRKSRQASQKAVQFMLGHPYSLEQMEEQIRQHRQSAQNKKNKSKGGPEREDVE